MAEVKWTEKQLEAIYNRKESLLVSAAAGSGKTAVLVERIMRIVMEDRVGLDRMLVVTFTNAAASEMKEKIRRSLNKALENETDAKERRRLRDQLSLLGRANISTFHQFCLEVIRNYYHIIGVSPSLSVCDGARQALMKQASLEELFEEEFAKMESDSEEGEKDSAPDTEKEEALNAEPGEAPEAAVSPDPAHDTLLAREGALKADPEANAQAKPADDPPDYFETVAPGFRHFLDCYATAKSIEPAKKMILEFYDFLQSLPFPEKWAEDMKEGKGFGPELYMDSIRKKAAKDLRQVINYENSCILLLKECPQLQRKLIGERDELAGILAYVTDPSNMEPMNAVGKFSWITMRPGKNESAGFEAVKDPARSVRDKGKDLYKELAADFGGITLDDLSQERRIQDAAIGELIALTLRFSEIYAAKKAKAKTLDFSDMEHFAIRILEDDGVAEEYRRKFQYIFVDEYQDSNTVQDHLLSRISRPDNCFMVGDVKQSIYKFRLAEPEIFQSKYKRLKYGPADPALVGSVVDLNNNFRSRKPIIDKVNDIFSNIMTDSFTGIDYDEDACLKEGDDPYMGSCLYEPQLHIVDMTKAKAKDADASVPEAPAEPKASAAQSDTYELDEEIEELKADEAEALLIVKLINEYKGKPIAEKKGGSYVERPLEYRDMAILLRSVKSRADVLYTTLMQHNIPVYLERDEGYFDTVEVRVFIGLLKLLDNRRQDIPLLSVLHFPPFGFNAARLAEIRNFSRSETDRSIHYNDAFASYAERGRMPALKQACRDFLDRLDNWSTKARYMPLADFVWMLLYDSGIADFSAAASGGEQRIANLRQLAEKASQYEETGTGGLHGFVAYLESLAEKKDIHMGQVKVLSESDNAVRIMTIHKSKGLEFPFVLVSGLGGGKKKDDASSLSFDKDLGVSMTVVRRDLKQNYKPRMMRLINAAKSADELAEDIRVLYVALTRAKDILLLTGTSKNYEKLRNIRRLAESGAYFVSGTYLETIFPFFSESTYVVSPEGLGSMQLRYKKDRKRLEDAFADGFDLSFLPDDELADDRLLSARLSFVPQAGEGGKKHKYSVSELVSLMLRKDAAADDTASAVPRPEISEAARPAASDAARPVAFGAARLSMLLSEDPSEETSLRQNIALEEAIEEVTLGVPEGKSGAAADAASCAVPNEPADAGSDAAACAAPNVPVPLFLREKSYKTSILSAAERGTAYHTVMERIPFTPDGKSPEDIQLFVRQLAEKHILSENEAAAVDAGKIAAFFSSEIGQRAMNSDDLRKELPFTLKMQYEGREVLVQGIIDCCFMENGKWILVDYKTNYVNPSKKEASLRHIKEMYEPQLALYRKALEDITGIPAAECVLYLISLGEELRVIDPVF